MLDATSKKMELGEAGLYNGVEEVNEQVSQLTTDDILKIIQAMMMMAILIIHLI